MAKIKLSEEQKKRVDEYTKSLYSQRSVDIHKWMKRKVYVDGSYYVGYLDRLLLIRIDMFIEKIVRKDKAKKDRDDEKEVQRLLENRNDVELHENRIAKALRSDPDYNKYSPADIRAEAGLTKYPMMYIRELLFRLCANDLVSQDGDRFGYVVQPSASDEPRSRYGLFGFERSVGGMK